VSAGDPATSREDAAERRRRWQALVDSAAMYGFVTMGGVIGSLLRWVVALVLPVADGGLPWATFFANATGCFAIGFYATLTGPDGRLFVGPRMRQFFTIGICGGYTTFSAFSFETLRFVLSGDGRSAVIYLAISLASWLAAVWLGDVLAQRLNNMRGI
jgi:fluoride exporter